MDALMVFVLKARPAALTAVRVSNLERLPVPVWPQEWSLTMTIKAVAVALPQCQGSPRLKMHRRLLRMLQNL